MLSIIIPTLNEESVIEKTLTSLKSKLSIPYEIIISDGRSSDRTAEIAGRYADKVIVYSGKKRQTIAEGRNDGAKAARGEFLVFMDADCTIKEPDSFFNKIMKHFGRDPKLVAVNVAIRVLPEFETLTDWVIFNLFNDYLWFVNDILHFGMSAGEFQMIRKDAFDRLGGYNGRLAASEDIELFSRLAKAGHVRYEKGLVIYHTGRRAHKIGWLRLLSLWFLNSVFMVVKGRAFVKEWEPIR